MDMKNKNVKKEEAKNQPVKKIRISNVSVTVWKNETEKGSFLSFNFAKHYTDKKGEWKQTDSFGLKDITALSFAIGELVKYVFVESKIKHEEEEY